MKVMDVLLKKYESKHNLEFKSKIFATTGFYLSMSQSLTDGTPVLWSICRPLLKSQILLTENVFALR